MAPLSSNSAAAAFVERWLREPGNEKQQTQAFWTELLHDVLGVERPTDAIVFEYPVEFDKSTRYIDAYLPASLVLIEQKSADIDLAASAPQSDGEVLTPYEQAERYATKLPHDRNPRWIITCNFRELRIYDRNISARARKPVTIPLRELSEQIHILQRILTGGISESERIEKEKQLSIQAGELISRIYNALLERCPKPLTDSHFQMLNRFCVRLVFCLYADDAELFAKGQFLDYLRSSSTPNDKRRSLLTLFRALNESPEKRDPFDSALRAFPHVNGGLFEGVEKDYVPMFDAELCALIEDEAAAGFNWADISPTIFGGLFESTINPKKRRMGGMHYTSVENIHKVIDPLFLDELKAELASILGRKERSGTARARKLKAYCAKLASLIFLDPACGSGNFLTETFISLRRLENEALRNLAGGQGVLDLGAIVSINQFYGIEINDFAVAVAKTALWIAAAQMWKKTQEFTTKELPDFLPLESYDNIREADALPTDWTENVPGRHLNYVISNPPFVGHQWRTREQTVQMGKVFRGWGKCGKLDYVCSWFAKATELMQADPATRTAFVATNSIVQGESVACLWKSMTERGAHIDFAYRTFKWEDEAKNMAAVHCVIVGFSCGAENREKLLIGETGEARHVPYINGYLLAAPEVFLQNRGKPLTPGLPEMTKGSQPTDGGNLLLGAEEYEDFIRREPRARDFIRPFMGAQEFINGEKRYCLWLVDAPPSALRSMPLVRERVERVREFRIKSPTASVRRDAETPYLFTQIRQPTGKYLAVPETSSENREYIPMGFFDADTLVGNALRILPDASLYHFGILSSAMHTAWMRTIAGRLEMRYRYSPFVYNNFPWPTPTAAQHDEVEACAQAVLDARANHPESTLADLYDPLLMPPDLRRAHKALNAAVDAAYGRKFADEAARVAHLFTLYGKLVRSERG